MPDLQPLTSGEEISRLFSMMHGVQLPRLVARYISRLVTATHATNADAPEFIRRFVRHGSSPRAAIALAESARAVALLAGRGSVGFEDVKEMALPVLRHRLILGYEAGLDRIRTDDVIRDLVDRIEEVPGGLPRGVSLRAEGGGHA